ncbi:hypothetical protein A9G45_04730 [Gilliamella sp. HK2]|jgi:hypothetical protein|uniref:DUF4123 domain-containing protein n=1 Tax=unclassified Gilliamella TaxID=2685620 RepID=UPI00080E2021|nr:DUF4123 domain-containing protein [Gilliamella apicola]OCG29339.1 hypothetical protein A9G45_04730 [Gilliamella apicola]OCG29404.1 hypothetical protein A9G46_13575 [Gilliamella apicola]
MKNSIPDNEISQTITQHLMQFGKLHLLVDPKINDVFFLKNNFDFESIVPVRDRQDTVSTDYECLQLCTISKQSIAENTQSKPTSILENIIQNLNDKKSAAIAILFSLYPIDYIQKQISNAMFMRYDGSYYLFRFYDPKVLNHLVRIFNQQQLDNLFGVIEYWYYWHDNYIELHHKPEIILSDIDYQIDYRQWQQLNIAQSYNYYEHITIKQQNNELTVEQKDILNRLLDWIYIASYTQPDKQILNYMVSYIMAQPPIFFQSIDKDLCANLINNKDINKIKKYFNEWQEGIKHGIA